MPWLNICAEKANNNSKAIFFHCSLFPQTKIYIKISV